MDVESPIFLIPRGRTGGTLLATILGSHRGLSFGYEVYPDLLEEGGRGYRVGEMLGWLPTIRRADEEKWIREMPRNSFRTFCARVRRCGVSLDEFSGILREFGAGGGDVSTLDGRLDLIERVLRYQMGKSGKVRWGSKMRVEPEILFRRYPGAVFLMMLRDGRDVLDSRLKVGSFHTKPQEVAQDWIESLAGFEAFLRATGARGSLVRYEDLVVSPRETLVKVCEICALPFEEQMLTYEEGDLSLLKSPHGHLSAQQIAQGLNTASLGRFRTGLSGEQRREFEEIAGAALRQYGYDLETEPGVWESGEGRH